jgi:hypothetical protein
MMPPRPERDLERHVSRDGGRDARYPDERTLVKVSPERDQPMTSFDDDERCDT